MRLGLALRKSQSEIRALPYPEYHRWQLMYILEPWGWTNDEYLAASIVSKLHNVNVSEERDLKSPAYFMRDMGKEALRQLAKQAEDRNVPDLSKMEPEERAALVRQSMKEFFGV
jgi:hypothetical protein